MRLLWAFEYRCHGPSKGDEECHIEDLTAQKVERGGTEGGFDDFAYRGP